MISQNVTEAKSVPKILELDDARIEAILNGTINPNSVSNDEILEIEKRVFKAITSKMLYDESKMTFADHDTLQ